MKVNEVMNRAVVIEENIKLKEAAKIMSEKRIGSLIILRGDKIIGIITESDVLKNISKLDENISKVMSKNVITVEENENLDDAALTMAKNKIKRLPVLKKGSLVGIVTATDIIANSEELNEQFFWE